MCALIIHQEKNFRLFNSYAGGENFVSSPKCYDDSPDVCGQSHQDMLRKERNISFVN